jgi:hypothetical protein
MDDLITNVEDIQQVESIKYLGSLVKIRTTQLKKK